jgi:chain length determinant protein EpsF
MDTNMNLMQMLRILRLRWWLILLLFVLSLAAGYAFMLLAPKRFASTVSIIVDTKTDPLLAALAPNLGGAYLLTQAQIIKSDRIASRVVKMLGLAENPAAVDQWREETDGRVPIDTYFGELLLKGLSVDMGNGSSILSVTYVAKDPKFAAAVANTFARAYIDLSVEFKVGPAREYSSFFDERQKALRSDLEAAQARLGEFQKKRGIVVSAEKIDMETARLTSLEAALATAMAESAETSSRQRNTGLETSVDVQQSGAVQGLKGDLARAETKLNEVSTTYGANHPARIQLEAQIAELKDQIAKEMRRVSGATSNVNRIASQKIGELRSLVDAQKRTVLSMRAERDEASVLLRDLETAQKAYEQVAQRRSQLANESQADQATAHILSPAAESLKQTFPSIEKTAAIAVAVGLLAGIAAALGWEVLDRRVRGDADMQSIDGVPLLGVISARAGRPGEVLRLAPARRPSGPPLLEMERGA